MRAITSSRLIRPLALILTILLTAVGASAQLVSDGATAIINGTATNIASFLTIGNTGPNTTLIVTNSGSVTADNAGIGGTVSSSNNLVAVSGAGSRMTTPGGSSVFRIGNGAAFNRLTVSQGGAVTTGFGVVGFPAGASNNSVVITDSGSAWTNNVLYVGEGSRGNSLQVVAGARVVANASTIGVVAGGNNNWVTVTGSNSLWSTVNNVLVGDADGQNRLFVNNGGKVTSGANITLGNQSTSSGNLLSVTAGAATATNASGTGTLDVRRGNVEFNDGLITADRLLVTNAQGSFTFNGGTLITRGATINNGQDFVVGANAGTGPADATFDNTTDTTIPGSGTVGPASPYPSVINIANVGGTITKITVTLLNLSHTYPNDLEVLLVGPDGQKVLLMSDAGGIGPGIANVNLTFDDAAGAAVPATNPPSGTYLPTDNDPGDLLPQPAPAGPYSTNLAVFKGSSANGEWSLFVSDDLSGDSGSLDAWSLNIVTTPASVNLANGALITIDDAAPATPYPSVIDVTNLAGVVSRLRVTVSNFTHTSSFDVDMLLVNPEGAAVALMRNAGGNLTGATLTFDDAASSDLPFLGSIVSGTYRPTAYFAPFDLPFPAPAGPYSTELALFNGSNPNGGWSLFVSDSANGDVGAINNGWSLHLETITPATWDVRSNATPTTVAGDLKIGQSASNARLLITNGGTLSVSQSSALGLFSSNNLAIISGSNSVWHSSSGAFTDSSVGVSGSFNTLLITNGGSVDSGSAFGFVGQNSGANYNRVIVTGPGSVWNGLSVVKVGDRGSFNSLLVTNGGRVESGNIGAKVGTYDGADHNQATVTGPGSVWSNLSGLTVGDGGSFNSLLVTNGGQVTATGNCYVGGQSGSVSNRAEVTGSNSVWSTPAELYVGDTPISSGNLLLISSGGKVTDGNGSYIGTRGSENQVMVTGSGSLWSSSAMLNVGYEGGANSLLLTNGGTAQAPNVFVGTRPASANNRLTVAGGTLRSTNVSSTAVLDIRRGTNVLNAGLIEVDTLLLTNTAGFFEFNGGTINTRSATAANGALFTIGNGSSAAAYNMIGTNTHAFASGLRIANNATLTGNGNVNSVLTVASGGTLAPGLSIGRIVFFFSPSLQGNVAMEISKSGVTLAGDRVDVSVAMTYGGSLTVSNLGPDALALGNSFQLFSAPGYSGVFNSISLPALPAGLSWTNRLLINGAIAVVAKTAPNLSGLTKSGTNLVYNVTGGSPGAPWYRLTSTNVALPLANWITNGTGVFDWVGNVTITNVINSAEPQRYFRIYAP